MVAPPFAYPGMRKIKKFRPVRRLVLAAEIERNYSRRNPRIIPHGPSAVESVVLDTFQVTGIVGRDLFVRRLGDDGEFCVVVFEPEVVNNIRRGDLLSMSIVLRRQYDEWE